MLHPSYQDLMESLNSEVEQGEQPVVNSRYSVVHAAAKRARQIVDGAQPMVTPKTDKPLSTAVQEIYEGKVHILSDNEESTDEQ